MGLLLAARITNAAFNFNDPGFANLWNRVDKPVQNTATSRRGYTWGPPVPNTTNIVTELYNGVPRKIQYFDKARMEVNNPKANPNDPYYVTTGLLVKEMVTGQRQDGDNSYTALSPSQIQIAGDSNSSGGNTSAPTYASFKGIASFSGGTPSTPGSVIKSRIDKAGQVSSLIPPEQRKISGYDKITRHNIADVFVNFGNQTGPVWNGKSYVQEPVMNGNPTYVLGRPITEPYWIRAVVGGAEKDILVQLFERRVLTYTPANPGGFQVEMGNVGQHYYNWRYLLNNPCVWPATSAPIPAGPITTIYADKGRGTVEDWSFHSPILGKDMPFRIYLPAGYDTSNQRYPVLYMLHGYSGDYREWDNYGLLGVAMDLTGGGTIQPYIIVLPSGEQAYWMNHANCGPRWGDYTAFDVVNFIDAHFRTIASPDKRAIGGLSMGGDGSLQIGFNYPKVFSIIGGHSPTIRPQNNTPDYFGDARYFPTIDPISLAQTVDLTNYKIWIDIGQDDSEWRARTELLHQVLLDRGKNHAFNIFPGGHGGVYWASHAIDYLQFYNSAFGKG